MPGKQAVWKSAGALVLLAIAGLALRQTRAPRGVACCLPSTERQITEKRRGKDEPVRTRYEPKDMDRIFGELNNDNHRAVIIVGGSLLEYGLAQVIKSRLREPASKDEEEELLSDNGIMGSFHQKILLAYSLRLIGPSVRRDFDLIRKIRNEVAHNMNPVSFDLPPIADRCRELVFGKETIPGQQMPPDLRGKFLVTINFYTGLLVLRATDYIPEVQETLEPLNKYLDS
jgi:DNA-binding MltR family transcriptional regulator